MEEYSRHVLKKSVAQICLMIGWNSIHSTPLQILTDILQDYIQGIARLSNNYAMLYGQTEPNMDHLGLAFNDVGISISELQEYVKFIDTSCVADVPLYPLPRESHLNMLKPGSREVVTRPVHIHEHLPPMHPELEDTVSEEYVKESQASNEPSSDVSSPQSSPIPVFKRPGDPVSSDSTAVKRQRHMLDDEIRPLREISSVMMTTSGFLSPAREGKLPEARTIPIPMEIEENEKRNVPESEPPTPPPPKPSVSASPPDVKPEKKKKNKSNEISKKTDKENKIKDEIGTSLPLKEEESKVKKLSTNGKEFSKLKALKTGALKAAGQGSLKSEKKKHKQQSASNQPTQGTSRQNKAKSPKNYKRTFSPNFKDLKDPDSSAFEEKLHSEPDKQKLNIFKKISKVKEEHDDNKVDVNDIHEANRISFDETIEAVIQKSRISVETKKDSDNDGMVDSDYNFPTHHNFPFSNFNSDSPSSSNIPATPRTPDIPKITEPKKKKKDKHKDKHEKEKYLNSPKSGKFYDELPGKPKTPDVDLNADDSLPSSYSFYNFPPGPGLIPFSHPLIPPMPLVNLYPKTPTPPFMNALSKQDIPILPPSLTITPINPYPTPSVSTSSPSLPTTPSTSGKLLSPSSITTPTSSISSEPSKGLLDSSATSTSSKIPSSASPSPQKLLQKKEHSKEKKLKNKMKKKKNKKEKTKSKEKSERKKLKLEKKEKSKEKSKLKKEKKEKKKDKKDKKEKKKDKQPKEEKVESTGPLPKITVKLSGSGSTASSQTPPPEPTHRKIIIKPLFKKDEPEGPLTTNTSDSSLLRIKSNKLSKNLGAGGLIEGDVKTPTSSHTTLLPPVQPYVPDPKPETEVNKVWICPACRGPDDGSPMIACDSCDLWFHWTCVGIQEAPESDWYCQKCLIKNDELMEKTKKHKKKKMQSII